MTLHSDQDALYTALIARDPAYDGFYFVGVKTTGIYCRLTCPARKPKRDNVVFFPGVIDAEQAGFRPCMRCRPLDKGRPTSGVLDDLRKRVLAEPEKRWTVHELSALGYDASTVRRAFKREYGVTFAQFARSQRLGTAVSSLSSGATVIEAQLDAGYESASGFREAITKLVGDAPARAKGQRLLTVRWMETPIGAMLAIADDAGVHLLEFSDRTALPGEIGRLQKRHGPICFGENRILARLAAELRRYFDGSDLNFTVPVVQHGSAFENAVWSVLRQVPPGETRSYGQLARAMDRPEAARAVARANGTNQVAIIVPCHRVIGADGAMVGYGGKIWRKKWLLEHEHRVAGRAARISARS